MKLTATAERKHSRWYIKSHDAMKIFEKYRIHSIQKENDDGTEQMIKMRSNEAWMSWNKCWDRGQQRLNRMSEFLAEKQKYWSRFNSSLKTGSRLPAVIAFFLRCSLGWQWRWNLFPRTHASGCCLTHTSGTSRLQWQFHSVLFKSRPVPGHFCWIIWYSNLFWDLEEGAAWSQHLVFISIDVSENTRCICLVNIESDRNEPRLTWHDEQKIYRRVSHADSRGLNRIGTILAFAKQSERNTVLHPCSAEAFLARWAVSLPVKAWNCGRESIWHSRFRWI